MDTRLSDVLNGREDNYLFPFYWQRGDHRDRIPAQIARIFESGCRALCVESRPHPDFCGDPETQEYTGDNSMSPAGRSITVEQFCNRMILRQAMMRHGFKPFPTEWWHFTLADEPFPDTYFNFPVRQL